MAVNNYQVLPADKNKLIKERERGITQNSFASEYALFCCIRDGEVELLKGGMREYFSKPMVMGRMSGNSLRQIQYWAVSTISVGVHYAILGGLDETEAFTMSDEAIRAVDACTEVEDIFELIKARAVGLCMKVRRSRYLLGCSAVVKKALGYINGNLWGQGGLSLAEIAGASGVSPGYISKQFKKEVGHNISEYILRRKIELAKLLLLQGVSYGEISYKLGFCSESYFIACYKKVEGKTPHE